MKLIECPRDAMQGIKDFIPTDLKIKYINSLLKVGFDTIDVGSFVSPKAIPQLADTASVITKLNILDSKSKLLVIVANKRGAEQAAQFDEITYLGFPFSISETFQKKNINSDIKNSLKRLEEVQGVCERTNKKLVTYFSMAFGNPYGDEWSPHIVAHWSEKLLNEFGINILSLSDTIGTSNGNSISWLFKKLINEFPAVEFGAHLHTTPHSWEEKIKSAIDSDCIRFDSAIGGLGGCPMANDKLTGNMPTENIVEYLNRHNIKHGLNENALKEAMLISKDLFKLYV
jgi:hydroxymethylglutaryl-CoA lyase